uniref:Uncharacterized protein n=1 Tax=Oryza sativa subsp. japonica TaxID=39947 RepID=Q6Z1B7_ORYSJ|nr:hypothetical protein [Oryza sativa Japonica Group]
MKNDIANSCSIGDRRREGRIRWGGDAAGAEGEDEIAHHGNATKVGHGQRPHAFPNGYRPPPPSTAAHLSHRSPLFFPPIVGRIGCLD